MSTTIPIPRSHPSKTAHPPTGSAGPSTFTPPASSSISSATSSRRGSMLPPPLPHSTHSYGSVSSTPSMHSPQLPSDDTGVGPGPGPQRLPRPLTAAEIHLQLEKEQEGIVNRLTRELSMLRSRSSEGENHERDPAHQPSRLRSSSQASSVSRHSIRTGHSTPPVHGHGYYTPSHGAHSISGSAPINMPMSNLTGSNEFSLSSSYSSDVGGLEEAIRWKRELESVSKENEALRSKVKELERAVRSLRKKKNKGSVEGSESGKATEGQELTEGNLREFEKKEKAAVVSV